ncbi:hypothetical protein [Arthrobacter woluwensis]|uniref:hypothetical protein n=1 Tax=Arthrobacter woluwensis TaxID=156980 RepID=UPI001AAE1C35|nr:hypothetical protein [Arthrobacter woluwensis]QTF73173.1 hypothetical protein G8758_15065 [Arthrobacter woluwensis]
MVRSGEPAEQGVADHRCDGSDAQNVADDAGQLGGVLGDGACLEGHGDHDGTEQCDEEGELGEGQGRDEQRALLLGGLLPAFEGGGALPAHPRCVHIVISDGHQRLFRIRAGNPAMDSQLTEIDNYYYYTE